MSWEFTVEFVMLFVCLGLLALGQSGIYATLARIEYKVDALLKRGDL